MNPHPECGPCTLKWVYERVANSLGDRQRFAILKEIMVVLANHFDPSVNLGALCNRCLEAVHDHILASSAAYEGFKKACNQAAAALMESAKDFIDKAESQEERLIRACGLAAVSNVAPIAVPEAPFEFSLIKEIIEGRAPLPVPKGEVYGAASGARHVFYLADNAGEIGFDSLVIALLKEMGAKVTLVVKEAPFFDDATLADVHYFGLEKLVDTVHCVRNIFLPKKSDPELTALFEKSDLVISKGTGNFEALRGEPRGNRILYLLKVKCHPVSVETGTPQGEFVVRLEE
jgi:uncharacterized protein with ATP-grasp and redox domains